MTPSAATPSPAGPRPRAVDVAFWLLVVGAVLLVLNGLMALTVTYDMARAMASEGVTDEQVHNIVTFQRGVGVFSIVAGALLGFLSGRTRKGDPRFRRATIAFAVAISFLIIGVAVLVQVVFVVALIAVLPIIFGAIALMRPPIAAWFESQAPRRADG
ncbi:MAG: hypothetical protein WBB07_09430 [Mycobacterium sp.]